MLLDIFIVLASGLEATTYGFGEYFCGDYGSPRPCSYGAVTSSGVVFDPDVPQAAVAAPRWLKFRPRVVFLRVDGSSRCHPIRVVDKMNSRWIGKRGFDLTPAAVRLLTGKTPTKYWSGRVHVCGVAESNTIDVKLANNINMR